MPDITMCTAENCKMKMQCYRFTAKPSEYWQSFSDFSRSLEDGEDCPNFVKLIVKEKKEKNESL